MSEKRLHSICRWTFNSGKGGFVPGNVRPSWSSDSLSTERIPALIAKEISPRLPDHIELGFELHYDNEVNESNAVAVAEALQESGLHLAMITPGAHTHFGYGGIASLCPEERQQSRIFGEKTVDLAYGPLRSCWHQVHTPSFVLWNGSWGYDLASPGVKWMYDNLKAGLAELAKYEAAAGGQLYLCIEPKPNEGHPAMMPPTVASAILLWQRVAEQYGVDASRLGVNKEIGHSEMIGLDAVYDTIEEIDAGTLFHTHLNSQGYNDGLLLGGPGKYDIDFGTRVNGFNVVLARLFLDAGYERWFGHDMQARPYDKEEVALARVVRSILSWDACEQIARQLDMQGLATELANRRTDRAEDILRQATCEAQRIFDGMLK
ncbi:TIM barrel protein [Kamptonema cortianum]|nr:TIM barrel protein [Kamptonema cortianum]